MKGISPAILAAIFALAQAGCDRGEKPTDILIYESNFSCDSLAANIADEVFERVAIPVYVKATESKLTTHWYYRKHHSVRQWRRVTHQMVTGATDVLSVGDKLRAGIDAALRANEQFPAACHARDEYIWKVADGNSIDVVGNAGVSLYMQCNGMEERADQIISEHFAPIYTAHVGQGKLTSWSWATHMAGGKWRRMLTMTAADIGTINKMRASILSAAPDLREGREFVEICGSHEYYFWTTEMRSDREGQ